MTQLIKDSLRLAQLVQLGALRPANPRRRNSEDTDDRACLILGFVHPTATYPEDARSKWSSRLVKTASSTARLAYPSLRMPSPARTSY